MDGAHYTVHFGLLQEDIRLTPTSYIVLGLLDALGECTPYQLKQAVADSVGNFWSLQHAQLYSEPTRLAEAGYLKEEREEIGRRRKRYRMTPRGRAALSEWLDTPVHDVIELRDPGLLKLFFGADPATLATSQLEAHRRRLAEYEALTELEMTPGMRLALDSGIGHEREYVRFWTRLAKDRGSAKG
jgi:PadR family transcriptional regulator, regulatory protein AphA